MGAVAYRHVADNYIALFHHFIPPGMLEALYLIEGLQKAEPSVAADTVYSDAHGQSEIMFAFTFLLGIQLMPRIRGWKELKFYPVDGNPTYKHIDRIFTNVVDWKLIRDNWKDLMQIAISIQAGRIAWPMLLRKLSNDSRYNRVFAAARELGRVLRTVYPLNEPDLGFLSPYGRTTKRFGNFELDLKKPPEPWLKEALFRQAAKQARAAIDQMSEGSKVPKGGSGKNGKP